MEITKITKDESWVDDEFWIRIETKPKFPGEALSLFKLSVSHQRIAGLIDMHVNDGCLIISQQAAKSLNDEGNYRHFLEALKKAYDLHVTSADRAKEEVAFRLRTQNDLLVNLNKLNEKLKTSE